MHFYSASQIIKMDILVDLYAIFVASPLSIFGMPFQCCSVLFRDPFDLLLSCLSQKKNPYHNEYHKLSSFVRKLPLQFHQLI